ncbi:protein misato [Episyrphus balteatus]|uniref:protein misato n=1 Tax=Episyrphus balteatus TaxID=286459 RepID=UPI00248509EC|nr:protein misato [Episyrphus balteatus]
MSNTREVITFQFGNYANYIGAHWWNIQESGFKYDISDEPASQIDNDVLFREGQNYKRQTTFTPRLLLVDLDGSLKHLSEEGELYKETSNIPKTNPIDQLKEDLEWKDSDIEVIESEPLPKHEFQMDLDNPEVNIEEKDYKLSESVETWTDYLYSRYHPRTINIIKEYQHSPTNESFDTFSNGRRLWNTDQFLDDFSDNIRQYIEECDNCQGFQTIFDCHNGYSGLATQCLEYLNDEYSKANLAIPVFNPKSVLFQSADDAMTDSIRLVNIALTYSQLIEQSSMFLPLSTQSRVWRQLGEPRAMPLLNYEADNLYQTSSILASFLDTISLRYRLKDAPLSSSLGAFCSDLTNYGRKLNAGAMALPFQMANDVDLIDCLDKFEGDLFTQLSPNCKIGTNYVVQSVCVRGIPKSRLKRPMQQAQQQMKMAAYRCDSISQMFQLYLQCQNHSSMAHVSALEEPMTTATPFPREMFDTCLDGKGFMSADEHSPEKKVMSVPTIASVQCSGDIADTLETLHREASRVKIAKLHRFVDSGFEVDDYGEALESLLLFKDNYEDNYEL